MIQKVNCLCCGKEFEMDIVMCCSGYECGCMGLPVDPIICSSKCYDISFNNKKNISLYKREIITKEEIEEFING